MGVLKTPVSVNYPEFSANRKAIVALNWYPYWQYWFMRQAVIAQETTYIQRKTAKGSSVAF